MANVEMMEFLRKNRPDAIGQATIEGKAIATLCTCGGGQGLKFLREMFERFLDQFPQVAGLKIATGDNASVICDQTCPYAHGTTQAQHAGKLFGTIDEVLHRGERKGRLMLYPWYWGPGFQEEILGNLHSDYLVMTKMEQNSLQTAISGAKGEPIFDDSIVSEQFGLDFKGWLERVGAERIIDMVPTGSGVDDLFFNFPPYPARLQRRLEKLRSVGGAAVSGLRMRWAQCRIERRSGGGLCG